MKGCSSFSLMCYKTALFRSVSFRPSRRSWSVWSRNSSERGTIPRACWPSDRLRTSSWPVQWPVSTLPLSVSTRGVVARYPEKPITDIYQDTQPLPSGNNFRLYWKQNTKAIWRLHKLKLRFMCLRADDLTPDSGKSKHSSLTSVWVLSKSPYVKSALAYTALFFLKIHS